MTSHTGNMTAIARMGFNVVPQCAEHRDRGPGLLYMGEVRFEPFDDSEALSMTWEEIGPLQRRETTTTAASARMCL